MDIAIGISSNPGEVSYEFKPGRRSILAEIYFPRRIATQGSIFNTLEKGLNAKSVRKYFRENAAKITRELNAYPHWLDPNRYGGNKMFATMLKAAKARFEMYEPVFHGWSMYEVAGAYVNENKPKSPEGKFSLDEEQTQVVRLMFRFEDMESEQLALKRKYPEVYRVILYWVLSAYGHADVYESWSDEECKRFLRDHSAWERDPGRKAFAQELYPVLAKRISKWINDCGLFIFGYLVREFWLKIVELHKQQGLPLEDEIWVSSIFHINVNIMTYKKEKKGK